MNRLLVICLAFGLATVIPVGMRAQASRAESEGTKTSTPPVDQILKRYVDAIGGKDAIEKVNSRLYKGTVEGPIVTSAASWEFWAKAPNKRFSAVDVGGWGVVKDGFDGKVAWSQSPAAPVTEKTGDELAKVKRDAEFYRELRFKAIYPDLQCKGVQKVGSDETYVLESKPAATSLERFYFDTRTGRTLRQDSELETAQGRVQTIVLLEDYRTVDGIKFPFVMRFKVTLASQTPTEFTVKLTEVKHNVPMEDAKFAKPAS